MHPKLIDFGCSTAYTGNSFGFYGTKGSWRYMAPEIHRSDTYNATEVDVFALGVTLFGLYTGLAPFANSQDRYYKILRSKPKKFFKLHWIKDDAFAALLTGMLRFDSSERFSLPEIYEHEWCQGPHSTEEEVIEELTLH